MKKILVVFSGLFFLSLFSSIASESQGTLKEYQKLGFSKEKAHLVPIEEISKLADVQGELRENLWTYGELSFKSIIAPEVIEAFPTHSSLTELGNNPKEQSPKSFQTIKTIVLVVSPKKSLSHLIKKAPKSFTIPFKTPAKVAALTRTSEKSFIITLVTIEPPRIP
ncbi:hypothetical protein [Candidatus Methylacidiphilum infernorum]|uniref:Uncharacterized protein n=1 Tax=Methylacidiphilum infernorum (isolate V4) TaxID=481448 RepID=B3DV03_METI4|nr:hypothetical protein [Candidatus Methylacidiphilum infernorum]ACD83156.1 Hypothetical protein Minf_1101 [Methylacidiphilum infernorum V4]